MVPEEPVPEAWTEQTKLLALNFFTVQTYPPGDVVGMLLIGVKFNEAVVATFKPSFVAQNISDPFTKMLRLLVAEPSPVAAVQDVPPLVVL